MIFEKLIVLMGIDGSGKTTHAHVLQTEFRNSGIKCKYVWFRSAYFFSLPFMAICRVLGFAKLHRLPNGHTYPEHLYSKRPISLLWPWIQFFDTAFFSLAKIKSATIFDDMIIADRFAYDIIIDVMIDIGNPLFPESFVGKLIRRLIPSKTIFVVLDIDEQTALQRKTDIPNLNYLKIRRRSYLSLAGSDMTVIDSSGSFQATHEHLLRNLQIQRGKLASVYIEKKLQERLIARMHWARWKKGPIPKLRGVLTKVLQSIYSRDKEKKTPCIEESWSFENGRSVGATEENLRDYLRLLAKRGLVVHSIILLGSRAKNRGKPTSDIDLLVVASGLPKTMFKFLLKKRRASVLTDTPLFLKIESHGLTRDEFLRALRRFELVTLDALLCGKVLVDDGFWAVARREYASVQNEFCLDNDKLRRFVSLI